MLMKYKDFRLLSKDEMKKVKGGDAPCGCSCSGQFTGGTVAHCYGSQGNCTDPANGNCVVNPGGPACFEYCYKGADTCWITGF